MVDEEIRTAEEEGQEHSLHELDVLQRDRIVRNLQPLIESLQPFTEPLQPFIESSQSSLTLNPNPRTAANVALER